MSVEGYKKTGQIMKTWRHFLEIFHKRDGDISKKYSGNIIPLALTEKF